MKKRILAILVSAAVAMSLAGCSDNETKDETSKRTSTTSSTGEKTPGENNSTDNPGSGSDNSTSSAEESKPSEPDYPEATNVLYAQGEKLDFPETPLTDFDYEISGNYAVIKEYFGKSSDVRIPETIEGKPVRLGSDRVFFDDHNAIKRLILPDGFVLTSGTSGIGLYSVESITFLGSLLYQNAPYSFNSLKSVYFAGTIPERYKLEEVFSSTPWYKAIDEHKGLVVIEDTLICGYNCSGDVVIPKGIKKINNEAFIYCSGYGSIGGLNLDGARKISKLNSVTLPEGLESIGSNAFYNTGLNSIKIPESVTSIGGGAFKHTPYIEGVTNDDRLAIDGKWLLDAGGAYGHITVPNGVTHIAGDAFSGAKMQSLTFPEGIEYIGDGAFSEAEIKGITIPDNFSKLTYAGYQAFKSFFYCDEYKDSDMLVFGSVAVLGHFTKEGQTVTVPDGVKCVSVSYTYGATITPSGWLNEGGVTVHNYRLASLILPDSINVFSTGLWGCTETVTYKGKTYNRNDSSGSELRAAIEGN